MKEITNFLSSPIGRTILITVVVILVSYIIYIQYQKRIFGGLTKAGIIKMIKESAAAERMVIAKASDNYTSGKYNLTEIADWYDNNQPVSISLKNVNDVLKSLNIETKHYDKFNYLVGQKIKFTNYV